MQQLGPLETKLMDVMWRRPHEPLTVREVLSQLDIHPPPAYMTVKTVLDNLRRKGWLVCHGIRQPHRYRPLQTREMFTAQAIRELLTSVDDIEPVVVHLIGCASSQQLAVMRRALRRVRTTDHRRL